MILKHYGVVGIAENRPFYFTTNRGEFIYNLPKYVNFCYSNKEK